MVKKHYVYRITNIILNKHYYGIRSSKVQPSQDLGIKYFSSSFDKEFMIEQQTNPENFKYKVIKIFETREEAIALEIKLHTKFDVAINSAFYNLAKSTSTRFDTTGVKCLETTKIKISEGNKGKIRSKETKIKMQKSLKGRIFSDETRSKISKSKKGKTSPMLGKTHSDESKAKNSEWHKNVINPMLGKTHSDEAKAKMSNSKKDIKQKLVQCPHCGKVGGINALNRWHFNNCNNILRRDI
jgi:hypothetical protein